MKRWMVGGVSLLAPPESCLLQSFCALPGTRILAPLVGLAGELPTECECVGTWSIPGNQAANLGGYEIIEPVDLLSCVWKG
jgi:hypothetical protein